MPWLPVTSYGARGDSTTDDTTAIQAAIDAAKAMGNANSSGAIVYFPSGVYRVTSPLVLPRNGLQPDTFVGLVGEDLSCVQIGNAIEATFPTNRAVIEWEATLSRVQHPLISDLCIRVPRVDGAMAIHFEPTLNTTFAQITAERFHAPRFHNLLIQGSNQYHPRFIHLEGEIVQADFENLYFDPSINTYTYDTVGIECDTNLFGNTVATGTLSGFAYSQFRNIHGSIRSGGYVQVFKGTFSRSDWYTSFCNGNRDAVGYEFINSFASILNALSNEGQGEVQFKLNNCVQMFFSNCGIGAPNDAGSGVNNGVELVGSTDCLWIGRATGSGVPSFTTSSVKMLTVDANSHRNTFLNVLTNDTFANEITNSGNDNYFEGYNVTGATKQYLGTLNHGGVDVRRLGASQGTALAAGDFALSAGWGTTASVGTISGTDQWCQFTVTSAGTGQGASPTCVLTFKDGSWTTAPIVQVNRQEFANQATVTFTVTTVTATAVTLTFNGTPVAAETYRVTLHVGGI